MGTRSNIGILNEDGSVRLVYCHWDGYFTYNGMMLFEHHNNEAAARELVRLGDISCLKACIDPPSGYAHSFEEPSPGVCIFYGRDRGDEVEVQSYEKLEDAGGALNEFLYLWSAHRGEWIATCLWNSETVQDFTWRRLSDIAANDYEVLEEENIEEWMDNNPGEVPPTFIPPIEYGWAYDPLAVPQLTTVPVETF